MTLCPTFIQILILCGMMQTCLVFADSGPKLDLSPSSYSYTNFAMNDSLPSWYIPPDYHYPQEDNSVKYICEYLGGLLTELPAFYVLSIPIGILGWTSSGNGELLVWNTSTVLGSSLGVYSIGELLNKDKKSFRNAFLGAVGGLSVSILGSTILMATHHSPEIERDFFYSVLLGSAFSSTFLCPLGATIGYNRK